MGKPMPIDPVARFGELCSSDEDTADCILRLAAELREECETLCNAKAEQHVATAKTYHVGSNERDIHEHKAKTARTLAAAIRALGQTVNAAAQTGGSGNTPGTRGGDSPEIDPSAAAAPSQWIDVRERLPTNSATVLINWHYEDEEDAIEVAWWNGIAWFLRGGILSREAEVTHWMPLPPPPSQPSK